MEDTFSPFESDYDNDYASGGPIEDLLQESALRGAKRSERYPNTRFFGTFCSYFPEEVILAFGLEPLRLLPHSRNATPAELPAYSCSLARSTLEQELQGNLSDLVGVGFAHTCDTMQCLSGIWADRGKTRTVNLVPPVLLNAAGSARYYQSEIKAAWSQLQTLSAHEPDKTALREAMELCEKIHAEAAELDALRPQLPSPLVAALLRAGQLIPRKEYSQILNDSLPLLKKKARGRGPGSRARILITGAVLESDSLFAMIEELCGRVVADDTCTGYRHYSGTYGIDLNQDWSLEELNGALVKRYQEMPPCPCRHQRLEARSDYLTKLAADRQAEGVILIIRKYCDPHAWDAVNLVRDFQREGLRTLVLELEGADLGGPERTRLQAFLESILENRTTERSDDRFREDVIATVERQDNGFEKDGGEKDV